MIVLHTKYTNLKLNKKQTKMQVIMHRRKKVKGLEQREGECTMSK